MGDADQQKLQNAYDLGRRDGVRAAEPLPAIPGWPLDTVRWVEAETRIDSYLLYERDALSALHGRLQCQSMDLEHVRRAEEHLRGAQERLDASRAHSRRSRRHGLLWLLFAPERRAVRDAEWELRHAEEVDALNGRCVDAITDALGRCREALDREVAAAAAAAEQTAGLRREPSTPPWVVQYTDVDAFIAEDRRRGLPDGEPGGADYGAHWTLEDPAQPWHRTTWRISWLTVGDARTEQTGEIYAYEIGRTRDRGRVWLLGGLARTVWPRDPLNDALIGLPRPVQNGRNSLLAAAEAIRTLTADHATQHADAA